MDDTDTDTEVDLRMVDYVSLYDNDNNLMCPICRCPLVEPVVVSDCDHHFCRACLQQTQTWSQYSGTCPTCRRSGRLVGRGSASKLLVNILDDLLVKCPEHKHGCSKEVKRGQLKDHVNKYCQYKWVLCPDDECDRKVRKKDAQGCLHMAVSCLSCRQTMTLADLESHWSDQCADHSVPCPQCTAQIPYRTQQSHLSQVCPESEALCPGHSFGCTHGCKRKEMPLHMAACTFNKLAPYLSTQRQRQQDQDDANQLLMKKVNELQHELAQHKSTPPPSIFPRPSSDGPASPHASQTYFSSSTLPDFDFPFSLPAQDSQPYASPTQHLLSLHENLRDEVSRQANTIHEVDARLSTLLVNENMRLKDEVAYQGAQLSALMRQVGWLTNAHLHGMQANANPSDPADQGPSESRSARLTIRRTTDEGRTKL